MARFRLGSSGRVDDPTGSASRFPSANGAFRRTRTDYPRDDGACQFSPGDGLACHGPLRRPPPTGWAKGSVPLPAHELGHGAGGHNARAPIAATPGGKGEEAPLDERFERTARAEGGKAGDGPSATGDHDLRASLDLVEILAEVVAQRLDADLVSLSVGAQVPAAWAVLQDLRRSLIPPVRLSLPHRPVELAARAQSPESPPARAAAPRAVAAMAGAASRTVCVRLR
jgi:hypothetical protein